MIFETVIRLFVSRGYEGATTKEIASIAGVNESTLFRKYGSKSALFEMAINHEWSDVPLSRLAPTGDLEGDLRAIVDAYIETNQAHGAVVPMLLTELSRSRDLEGAFTVAWGNISVVANVIRHYQSQASLQAGDPLVTLIALLSPLMVRQMFLRAELGFPIPEIDTEQYVRAFLEGHRPALQATGKSGSKDSGLA